MATKFHLFSFCSWESVVRKTIINRTRWAKKCSSKGKTVISVEHMLLYSLLLIFSDVKSFHLSNSRLEMYVQSPCLYINASLSSYLCHRADLSLSFNTQEMARKHAIFLLCLIFIATILAQMQVRYPQIKVFITPHFLVDKIMGDPRVVNV